MKVQISVLVWVSQAKNYSQGFYVEPLICVLFAFILINL